MNTQQLLIFKPIPHTSWTSKGRRHFHVCSRSLILNKVPFNVSSSNKNSMHFFFCHHCWMTANYLIIWLITYYYQLFVCYLLLSHVLSAWSRISALIESLGTDKCGLLFMYTYLIPTDYFVNSENVIW